MDAEDDLPVPEDDAGPVGSLIRGARLEPLRYVERELTRPDGTTLRVKVPVYPPFRLEDRSAPPPTADARPQEPARKKAS
jgi:hypothetical protein